MTRSRSNPMRDLLLARLAEKVGDLSPHINAECVASDLALVRWAAERQSHIGVTSQDRREVDEAAQQLNTVVFDSPDAPDGASFEQDRISLERSTAEPCAAAGRWLEHSDVTVEEEPA
jgi:hypothetical protein